MDYDKIFLSKQDRKIMEMIRFGEIVKLHPVDAGYLLSLHLIAPYALSRDGNEYVVTEDGQRFMEYVEEKESKAKAIEKAESDKEKANRRISWISIVVSNLIAFIALIISILK